MVSSELMCWRKSHISYISALQRTANRLPPAETDAIAVCFPKKETRNQHNYKSSQIVVGFSHGGIVVGTYSCKKSFVPLLAELPAHHTLDTVGFFRWSEPPVVPVP